MPAVRRLRPLPTSRNTIAAVTPLTSGAIDLTTPEVARELGVSLRRVQALIRDGRLRARRFGRAWMVAPTDLDAVRLRPPGRPKRATDATKTAPR